LWKFWTRVTPLPRYERIQDGNIKNYKIKYKSVQTGYTVCLYIQLFVIMNVAQIPIYRAVVDTTADGVYGMGLVQEPAIMRDFVKFARGNQVAPTIHLDKWKQLVSGPILIPNQLIFRIGDYGEPYYMYFTRSEIEKIRDKMMADVDVQKLVTDQHNTLLTTVQLVECWIIEDPEHDKSVAFAFKDLPAGTLMVTYKVHDKGYWEREILSGNAKGFSIEGFFSLYADDFIYNIKNGEMTAKKKEKTQAATKAPGKKSSIGQLLKSLGMVFDADDDLGEVVDDDETSSGTPYLIFTLGDGTEIFVDAEGLATVDGVPCPEGEYQLSDGNFIVIDMDGRLVLTEPSPEEGGSKTQPTAADFARERGQQLLAALNGTAPPAKTPGKQTPPAAKQKAAAAKTPGKLAAKSAGAEEKTEFQKAAEKFFGAQPPAPGVTPAVSLKIAQLEKEIAKLKGTPAVQPKRPVMFTYGEDKTPYEQRVGNILRSRLERRNDNA
jgi:hypothetical protein